MDKLWSPWRSQYIDSFSDETKPDVCVLCELSEKSADDPETLLVDKGKLTYSVLNLYPYNNGHLMVVPRRHTSDFSSLTHEEKIEIMEKLQLAEEALKIVSGPDGFNIGANLGKVSGAGIHEHLHFHIVPRWSGDTNFMPVLGEVKVISEDLLDTKRKLLKVYKDIFKKKEG